MAPTSTLLHRSWATYLLLLLVPFIWVGCNNTDLPEVLPTGNLSGTVRVMTELGEPLADLANVAVLVTHTLTNEAYHSTTDAQGQFVISSLPIGRYNVIYSRSDVASYRFFNMLVLQDNNTQLRTVDLVEPASIQPTEIKVDVDEVNQVVTITGTIDPPSQLFNKSRIRIFFSASSNPANDRYDDNISIVPVSPDTYIAQIQLAEFEFRGYVPGQRVHMIAYGSTDYVGDTYVDANTDLTIFTGLNPTPSVQTSVKMPVIDQ